MYGFGFCSLCDGAKIPFGEGQERRPVQPIGVAACVQPEGEVARDQAVVRSGHFGHAQVFLAEQAVNGSRSDTGFEFARWI